MPHDQPEPWYDPQPHRHLRRRDKLEFAIAALLLAGLLGLLIVGVDRDAPRPPRSTPSLSPP
ncbi:hypothetical protein [Actinoplanes friuliensis]|uniref:Uncharacterized protein n=1 Tax=Actinoplanes friuliensis DSM 7358 TaxID=1246995 RepID=U5WAC8_9ACTN|nr:hypothetical protein [Actinoplanes friuliensis]AGZ45982.1 hypothetical protein AFR_38640 [Actinoplanes friuliensis DSM 7358]